MGFYLQENEHKNTHIHLTRMDIAVPQSKINNKWLDIWNVGNVTSERICTGCENMDQYLAHSALRTLNELKTCTIYNKNIFLLSI